MKNYKITVVVPTYNTGDGLLNLFDSLKSQTIGFENIEVIFVDDKSTDEGTLAILNDLNSYDNVSVYYLDENSGFPGAGRNLGLSKAQGEFVIFSDHDDTYNKDAFEKMYEEIKLNSADLLFTNYYKVIKNKKEKVKTIFNGENIIVNDFKEDLRLFDLGPTVWTKLFRREFLINNNICFLEGMLAEDLEIYVHSLILSNKTVYLDDFYSYNYSIRDSNEDKSTIHLRNKLIFSKMIEGYYKTYDLIKKLDKMDYFDSIFRKHFVYFLTSLVKSNISDNDKKDLLMDINPLFKQEFLISPDFGEKRYKKLTKYLNSDDYSKALKELKIIRKLNKFRDLIKY